MKLESIEKATAKTGAVYFKLSIDGKNYNFFGEIGDLKIGDEVKCAFEQKGQYTNLVGIEKASQSVSKPQIEMPQMNVLLQRTDKPHSYEFGAPSSRHKIYYNEISELMDRIRMLVAEGLAVMPNEELK